MKSFSVVAFRLPGGKIVLQRRTHDAPYAPNKLGLFGGWMEKGETPEECIKREISEETSLAVREITFKPIGDFIVPKSQDFNDDRRFFLFLADINSTDFDVYEGQGAEAYTADELKARADLAGSELILNHILPRL